jgi:hypothetical protein
MMARMRQSRKDTRRGSALILTVVLTSLLAIVGVLFLMTARIDKMATSATADNRTLTFAVDTVLARIDEALVEDTPGVAKNQEYYDYPDGNDPWLADLEPYGALGGPYYWRQISNLEGLVAGATHDVQIDAVGERDPVADPNSRVTNADADGDGAGDARWFELPGMTSGKGKPIYAAVRVVDNGGMLNVSTGYKWDPNDLDPQQPDPRKVDGHSQLQVNILSLAARPGNRWRRQYEAALLGARANNTAGPAALDMDAYEREVIWKYDWPGGIYTPFDLSDELALRYRYLLDHSDIITPVYKPGQPGGWGRFSSISTPLNGAGLELDAWFVRATGQRSDPNIDPNYAYRHIATTESTDRIMMPKRVPIGPGVEPGRMVNINTAGEYAIRQAVTAALADMRYAPADFPDPAQIIANLRDYIDDDSRITALPGATTTSSWYGFEQPCIYISELAYRFVRDGTGQVRRSYAVELYKPYFEDRNPNPSDRSSDQWMLVIDNQTGRDVNEVITWSGTRRFHVLLAEDPAAPLKQDYVIFNDPEEPQDPAPQYRYTRNIQPVVQSLGTAGFSEDATIELKRRVGNTDEWVNVDVKRVPKGWMLEDGTARSLQRDIRLDKCIFRLWSSQVSVPSLGNAMNNYVNTTDQRKLQAHPANQPLTNIGELGMIFAWSAYGISEQTAPGAANLLINLQNPVYANLLNYLTVMDPAEHGQPLSETRIKGRININTAPPFVLAQLPWMRYRYNPVARVVEDTFNRAMKIVQYRDKNRAFKSTAGLLQVPEMCELGSDGVSNQFDVAPRGPDLTPDPVVDDLEERDLIFTRISDLVTVRSDVFTAYILVRIGPDGPQKRVIAVLDRSRVESDRDRVRILALQQVPDPR